MHVRLAFAGAGIEPEILIVDEVLTVGDVEFQNVPWKNVGSGGGATQVLFVSHNMAAIEALCPDLIPHSGTLCEEFSSETVIATYLKQNRDASRAGWAGSEIIQDGLKLECIRLSTTLLRSGEPLEVEFKFLADEPGQLREFAALIYSAKAVRLAIVDLREWGIVPLPYRSGRFAIRTRIASLPLVEGSCSRALCGNGPLCRKSPSSIRPDHRCAAVHEGIFFHRADTRIVVLNTTTSVVFDQTADVA